MSRLGMNDLRDIESMTIVEFGLRMEAYKYKRVDELHDIHLKAFLNNSVKAQIKKGSGKNATYEPAYKTFESFFDYDATFEMVTGRANPKRQSEPKQLNNQQRLIMQANNIALGM